jgi:catechol 2,3-dioxygenase-like lactoylglutathione lyase family enzyme
VTTATGIGRLRQISMRAHDVERAVRFYRDLLAVPFLFAFPPRLAFFDCGGVRLMLSTPEPGFDHPGSVLYFAVEDITQAYETLKAPGVTFTGEPHKIATLADREVWLAEFRQRREFAGAHVGAAPREVTEKDHTEERRHGGKT